MRTKVEICHIDSNRCVVRVSGFEGERDLGSSLGEAPDAEAAEDRARQRLEERQLKPIQNMQPKRSLKTANGNQTDPLAQKPLPVKGSDNNDSGGSEMKPITSGTPTLSVPAQTNEQFTMSPPEPSEVPTDPEDWSEELTAIDLQLKRIRWTREHESEYLERAYGHGSRHKLTRYSDLVSYLNTLKSFEVGDEAAAVQTPLRRGDLITQGDEILTTLKWDQERAKSFLQSKLGATSRQQLSDEQLFEFNMFLEEQLIAKMPKEN